MLGEDADEGHRRLLQAPGKLTLSGYNTELSNKPCAHKRGIPAKSNLRPHKELAEATVRDAAAIGTRGWCLAERVVAIWLEQEGL